jgi:hypothetical protein
MYNFKVFDTNFWHLNRTPNNTRAEEEVLQFSILTNQFSMHVYILKLN